MAKKQIYDPQIIDTLKQELRTAEKPKPRELSLKQVVEGIREDIIRLLEDGWTWEEVHNLLKTKNLSMALPTLQKYTNYEKSPKSRKTTRRRSRTPAAKPN